MSKNSKLYPGFYSCLALFLGICIALLLAEGIIRSTGRSKTWNGKKQEQLHHDIIRKYIDDYQNIGYTFKPNVSFNFIRGEQYTINNEGFRDQHFTPAKKKRRVAFIGDSVIEGFGVEKQDRISDIVAKSFPNKEFLNFGMGGYSTFDAWYILKEKVAHYYPDLLVIQVCHNDLEHNFNVNNSLAENDSLKIKMELKNTAQNSISSAQNPLKQFFRNHSALYLFLAEYYQFNQLKNNKPNPLLTEILQTDQQHWEISVKLWQKVINYCLNQNIKPVFMYVPYECEVQVTNDSLGNYFTNKLADFCKQESVDFINTTKSLRQVESEQELYFDHCHLDVNGNKIVANQIKEFFKNKHY